MHLACGLSVGLTGLAAGYAIGVAGDNVGDTTHGLTARWILLTFRSGRAVIHAAIQDFRRHGAHLNLWGGSGTLRVRRHPVRLRGTDDLLIRRTRLIVALILNAKSRG